MPISIPNSGGGWLPTIKFNATDGRWSMKNVSGEWEEVEKTKVKGLFHFPLLRQGWFNFAVSPPFKLYGSNINDRPNDPKNNAIYGVSTVLYSPNSLGGTYEFLSTSSMVCAVIGDLLVKWETDPEGQAKNQLMAVECTGINSKTNSAGKKIYTPEFTIKGYLAIPDDLNVEFSVSDNQYMQIEPIGETSHPSSVANGSVPTSPAAKAPETSPPPATKQQDSDYF
ncbi:MAG: hypothetical protein GOVbin707_49 [Prokaryotic dsDNA virus sp.]|nr:MAG: hypothetical protein GOVbin707_49 [Prokaryotic dsDNA virus sp.]|tara:strand:- start:4807 stop:5481 length:675 start_codon:yes stop_codon:yes gene_type:complete